MTQDEMLRKWAALSKGLALYLHDGNLADYDDELASMMVDVARATLEWRDGPGSWDWKAHERAAREARKPPSPSGEQV